MWIITNLCQEHLYVTIFFPHERCDHTWLDFALIRIILAFLNIQRNGEDRPIDESSIPIFDTMTPDTVAR